MRIRSQERAANLFVNLSAKVRHRRIRTFCLFSFPGRIFEKGGELLPHERGQRPLWNRQSKSGSVLLTNHLDTAPCSKRVKDERPRGAVGCEKGQHGLLLSCTATDRIRWA